MAHLRNRKPDVPPAAAALLERVTKAELLEVAYHLATLAAGEEDEAASLARLLEEINLGRASRGERAVPADALWSREALGVGT